MKGPRALTGSWRVWPWFGLGFWFGLGLGLGLGTAARAATVDVEAQVTGQSYELRTADVGSSQARLVDRRRLTTYLGLYLSGLGRKNPDGLPAQRDQIGVTLQLRFERDFGEYLCSIGRTSLGAPLGCLSREKGGVATDPELANNRPELLQAFVEGQRLGGWLDVRLGRQLQWELFDLRALDGLWLRAVTPLYVAIEAFSGLSVSGALPIDSPTVILDGTSRPALLPLGTDAAAQQARQDQALQPTVGFSLRSHGLRALQARLSYRRTFSLTAQPQAAGCLRGPNQSEADKACAPTWGTIEERIAYTVHGRLLSGRLQGWGGLRYDFVSGRFDDGHLGVRGLVRPGHGVLLEYRYSAPTWDGDSIFNVFSAEPYHDLRFAYDGRVGSGLGDDIARRGDLSVYARGSVRLFRSRPRAPLGTEPAADALLPSFGGSVGARWQRRRGVLRVDGSCDGGYGGLRGSAEVAGRLLLLRETVGLEGRLLYTYWADPLRVDNNAHGFSAQAGVRYAVFRGALLHLLIEDNVNRFYASQLRALAIVDLSYALGPHGGPRPPAGLWSMGLGGFPQPGPMPEVIQ